MKIDRWEYLKFSTAIEPRYLLRAYLKRPSDPGESPDWYYHAGNSAHKGHRLVKIISRFNLKVWGEAKP